jgi:hypothetical protein
MILLSYGVEKVPDPSEAYLDSLGNHLFCPLKCGGNLVPVLVRYKEGDRLKKELECTKCGKVIKKIPSHVDVSSEFSRPRFIVKKKSYR